MFCVMYSVCVCVCVHVCVSVCVHAHLCMHVCAHAFLLQNHNIFSAAKCMMLLLHSSAVSVNFFIMLTMAQHHEHVTDLSLCCSTLNL